MRVHFTDDAGGDDLVQAEWAADGKDALPFLHGSVAAAGTGQHRRSGAGQRAYVGPEQGHILLRIRGNQPGGDFVLAVKLHSQILRLRHHVLVGQDQALSVYEEARAVAGFGDYCYHRVLQFLELFGQVAARCARGARRRCGVIFLCLGVLVGQIDSFLDACERHAHRPGIALAVEIDGFGRGYRVGARLKSGFGDAVEFRFHVERGFVALQKHHVQEGHGFLVEFGIHQNNMHVDLDGMGLGLRGKDTGKQNCD